MGMQLRASCYHIHQNSSLIPPTSSTSLPSFSPANSSLFKTHFVQNSTLVLERCLGLNQTDGRSITRSIGRIKGRRRRVEHGVVAMASSSEVAAPFWDDWKPGKRPAAPSLSDVLWPSLGAFAAMAIFGKLDQVLAPKGLSMTVAPLGAVSAVLLATPSSPGARKYNMFMAQIGCAAIGVLAFSIFGPGWLARSIAVAASIAFMIYTGATHPPAASLPILFIDGAKFHHLNFRYALFPGATGCFVLCLIWRSKGKRSPQKTGSSDERQLNGGMEPTRGAWWPDRDVAGGGKKQRSIGARWSGVCEGGLLEVYISGFEKIKSKTF